MAEPTPGFWRLLATAVTDGETTEHGLTGSGPGVGGSGASVSHGTDGGFVGGWLGAMVSHGTIAAASVVVVVGSGVVVVRVSPHSCTIGGIVVVVVDASVTVIEVDFRTVVLGPVVGGTTHST